MDSKQIFSSESMKEQLIMNLGYQKDSLFLDGDRFSHIILRKLYEKSQLKENNNHELESSIWEKKMEKRSSTYDMTRQFLFNSSKDQMFLYYSFDLEMQQFQIY